MQEIPNRKLLQVHPDTVEVVRKGINLNNQDDMRQVIDILKKWIEMQPHFKKKDFTDSYLETCIVTSKGSVEKAKKRLDNMCTMKTLMPEFFEVSDPIKDFAKLSDVVQMGLCPILTKEHHRIFVLKAVKTPSEPEYFTLTYRYSIYLSEYLRRYDYVDGFRIIYDLSALENMVKFVSKINVVELRQGFSILMEGYGMKVRGIHMVTQSKTIDLFVNLFKQMLKPKIASRISIHRSFDEMQDIVDKKLLPSEMGGCGKPLKEIHDEWISALSSKEHLEYMKEMRDAKTDESLRQSDKFSEEYAGMPGTFRILSVD